MWMKDVGFCCEMGPYLYQINHVSPISVLVEPFTFFPETQAREKRRFQLSC